MQNLFRTIIIVISAIISITKIGRPVRRSLSFYENQYKDKIQDAFMEDPKSKHKLLEALQLYNEDKLEQTIRILKELDSACQTPADYRAVGLFTALAYTDMECFQDAIAVYEGLIAQNLGTSTIYSNLGSIYSRGGKQQKAKECYEKSLFLDAANPYAYNNMAKLYFDRNEIQEAEKYALKALEINDKVYQASTLLAIIYAGKGRQEELDKYAHMAVAAGQNPKDLNEAIAYYSKK